ncbi:MAG: hypothetical protein WCK65_00060 [Rhodospirillaceae bacterium]
MTINNAPLFAKRGQKLEVMANIINRSYVNTMMIYMMGSVSAADKDICRNIHSLVNGHRSGIVVICIDRLMRFDAAAERLIWVLAMRALVNFNNVHLVVGTGFVRARLRHLGYDNIAHLHDGCDGFLLINKPSILACPLACAA